jgi:RecA-family ATPase
MFDGEEILSDDEPADAWEFEASDVQSEPPSTQHEQPPEVNGDVEPDVRPYRFVKLEELTPEPVDWLWEGRIPRNMITGIEGNPGCGKSTVVMDLVARVTTGRPFPLEKEATHEPMTVLWITQEDSPQHVLLPRALACGVDLTRLRVMTEIDVLGSSDNRRDSLAMHARSRLEATFDEVMPQLVVFDPGSSTLEDGNSEAIARQVMGWIFHQGETRGITTLWIRHLVKNNGERGMDMAGVGSIGVLAAYRSLLMVHLDNSQYDDEKGGGYPRILEHRKHNLTYKRSTLEFRIDQQALEAPDGRPIYTSCAEWGQETELNGETVQKRNRNLTAQGNDQGVIDAFEKWAQKKGAFSSKEAVAFLNTKKSTKAKRPQDLAVWPRLLEALDLESEGDGTWRYSKNV